MSAPSKLGASWKSIPRAAKWLVGLVLFLLSYFLVIEPAVTHAAKWNDDAAALQRTLSDRAAKKGNIENNAADLDRAMVALGRPKPPEKRSDPVAALDRAVRRVLSNHSVTPKRSVNKAPEPVFRAKDTSRLDRSASELAGKLDRYAIELSLECDTVTLLAVLKDMEKSPDITGVSRLSVRRIVENTGPKAPKSEVSMLSVTLAPELWVIRSEQANKNTPAPRAKEELP
jgi:hypothetical protein